MICPFKMHRLYILFKTSFKNFKIERSIQLMNSSSEIIELISKETYFNVSYLPEE